MFQIEVQHFVALAGAKHQPALRLAENAGDPPRKCVASSSCRKVAERGRDLQTGSRAIPLRRI
jgi:hypothetical protein